jgi:hypothetical protein
VKQVTQRLRDGQIEVADIPIPELRPEGLLVSVFASLLNASHFPQVCDLAAMRPSRVPAMQSFRLA